MMLRGARADNVTAGESAADLALTGRKPAGRAQESHMYRIIFPLLMAAVAAGIAVRLLMRAQFRRKTGIPELNRHPERLEEMLDPTDDA
jgi:hypothetical protein